MGEQTTESTSSFRYSRFGLIVTGECEEAHLPHLFRCLMAAGNCTFNIVRRIRQRDSRGPRRELKMVGEGKKIPDRDQNEIGIPVRIFLNNNQDSFVLLIDDLEQNRRKEVENILKRYRTALDVMLLDRKRRASVHFLANMLEAYFYADPKSVKEALGLELEEFKGDVEDIRNPKADLKKVFPGYNEIRDGGEVLRRLDAESVLSDPGTCAFLRTLFAWCTRALRKDFTDKFQLRNGNMSDVTGIQLSGDYDPGQ